MKNAKLSRLLRYGIAVLTVVPVVLFTLFLHHVVHFTLNIAPLAIIALIVATWWGGFWQGMLAVLLLHLSVDYYLEGRPNPPYQFDFTNADLIRILFMTVFVALTHWRRQAQVKLDQRAQQQFAIADLGQKALAGADLQFLMEEAAILVAQHLKVDYSVLCELLPDSQSLQVKAGVGWRENMMGKTALLMDKAVPANRLLPSAAPVVISDHSRESKINYELPFRGHPITSSSSVMINGKDIPYGMLSALTRKRRKFTPDDVAFLQSIANVLAEAISRKKNEEEREQLLAHAQAARAHAEEANRLKDEFLATVSHELRTPLNHMLGWTSLLRLGKLPPEKVPNAIDTIDRNLRAQHRLVEDLLDVSRIITGKMQLHVQPLNPANVVEAALTSVRPAAEAKGVQIKVALDAPSGVISGDADRLQQVVWNLISNAIKFTPKGGCVEVKLGRTHSHAEIVVSDTGDGIVAEFLPHVFDRFRQADGSFTRQHGGLGLGLAIVRHLVELHGGTVQVESPGLGQGATFTVSLPLSGVPSLAGDVAGGEQPEPEVLSPDGVPRLTGTRVLIVDDEADTRMLLTTVLTTSGAELRVADGMAEALKVLAEWEPDVLVADIGMPNGSGYDLIGEVRQTLMLDSQALPAVALTAYARAEDRVRALGAGYQMHVAKPVEPKELLIVIASLVGRLA